MHTPRNDCELSKLLDRGYSIYRIENNKRILANTYKVDYNSIVILYDVIDGKVQTFGIGIY